MNPKELKLLATRLQALALFRSLRTDPVLAALENFLAAPDPERYAAFVCALYEANGGDLTGHIEQLCANSDTVYVRMLGAGKQPGPHLQHTLQTELATLQQVTCLEASCLQTLMENADFLPEYQGRPIDLPALILHRLKNIHRYGYGIYASHGMFCVDDAGQILPVSHPDPVALSDLVDYEAQRAVILQNTQALLEGKPAANILLTGDAGTGKSSTVKAVGNKLFDQGLRIVEVRKDQLRVIPQVLEQLSANPLKFILFIDDLSFVKQDDNFSTLKAVLEGSVTAKSRNVVIYATSNRRHIVRESFSERDGDEVHRNDTMQELVSLSARFGIHITFSKPNKSTYLNIVHHLARAAGLKLSEEELDLRAEQYALERGGRNARLARQLVDRLLSEQ